MHPTSNGGNMSFSLNFFIAFYYDTVTLCPETGIVKSEGTSIARQLLGKEIPAATNTQATVE
jgi:hypothetical protein